MPYSYKLVSILAAHTYMSDTQKRKMERYIGHYGATGTQSSAVLRGTHCHLHVGLVPHVSESSPSAVLQRRLIRCYYPSYPLA
jgi:hypothetical protein